MKVETQYVRVYVCMCVCVCAWGALNTVKRNICMYACLCGLCINRNSAEVYRFVHSIVYAKLRYPF